MVETIFVTAAAIVALIASLYALTKWLSKFIEDRRCRTNYLVHSVEWAKSLKTSYGSGICSGDILSGDTALIEPTIKDLSSGNVFNGREEILSRIESSPNVIIIGKPGYGKTIIAQFIFRELCRKNTFDNNRKFPIFIQSHGIAQIPHSETNDIYSSVKNYLNTACPNSQQMVYIFESVDEYYLNTNAKIEFTNIFDSSAKKILFMRDDFYRNRYTYDEKNQNFEVFELMLPSKENLKKSIMPVLLKINRACENDEELSRGLSAIAENMIDKEIVNSPQQLAMILTSLTLEPEITLSSTNELYMTYIKGSVLRDINKTDTNIDAYKLIDWYSEIIGLQHLSQASKLQSHYLPFDANMLSKDDNNSEFQQISRIVRERKIFINRTNRTAIEEYNFPHLSFNDFFLARIIWKSWRISPQRSADYFKYLINQEVYEFLRRYFLDIGKTQETSLVLRNAEIMLGYLGIKKQDRFVEEGSYQEIAFEQIMFLLAHINDDNVRDYITAWLNYESTTFIRRGLSIGLSFGGNKKFLSLYIKELFDEYTNNQSRIKNLTNLDHQIKYFGTQLNTIDQLDSGNLMPMIDKLLSQVQSKTHEPTKELDLYTLWYLLKNTSTPYPVSLKKNIDKELSTVNFEKIIGHKLEVL